jgi:isoleucyl-tRNA synthetase
MSTKFNEYKNLDLPEINREVLQKWELEKTFEQSISNRQDAKSFVFYEGPPSANGMPGIHHVMARSIKDIFCRFQSMRGFQVHRKAGWDTHGLPVELGVEKALGITKEDIGKKISVEEYNKACRKDVMKYTGEWERLTKEMGYWVDMKDPYITYENKYIETLWYLLKEMYNKQLLYKGYTIQPYSPAAGTGLSSHELNQLGCYKDVKDTTCVAQFKVVKTAKNEFLFNHVDDELFFLAWTTTPWTLPSNTALCVGPDITYFKVKTFNPYTGIPVTLILAKNRLRAFFPEKDEELSFDEYKVGDKHIPFKVLDEFTGSQLNGVNYEQLLPWVNPGENAFQVITGDFVTTEDGTGIVHIAPTFGADDYRVAKDHGIPGLMVLDKHGNHSPLVDKTGKMILIDDMDADYVKSNVNIEEYKEFAGRFVKNAYDPKLTEDDATLDVDISVKLKQSNKAFKIEKHVHTYPHCWRTDKPVLYYPMDSWFIRTTEFRTRMMELNKTINWKPESTGTGRFGKWLENLQDWNLSRSRYWGTPLPIWTTEDKTEQICIGSVAELKTEVEKSVKAGLMSENAFAQFIESDFSKENYNLFDLHRPFVDNIVLVSPKGQKMTREMDLIDVWFDSGAMPYAQLHYPFENKDIFENVYPANFIAEGVDQTRGWFFTLHAISSMLFDSVAFKNVVSNGLVLDKHGNKMSKRHGNAVDPFETIAKYGSDPLRWYLITNASPWENLKFDLEGIDEVKRKFFGTLYNTYSFFALYANVDEFTCKGTAIPLNEKPELDKWILSLLNTLKKDVAQHYEEYEPTKAGRAIQDFVCDNLSNWFIRLSRKRFWGTSLSADKISAYQTLCECLETISLLMAPIAPFYADKLFCDLNAVTGHFSQKSVHLADFPKVQESYIDKSLEERMSLAQKISSMVLALRKKVNIRVRQPLNRIMIPTSGASFEQAITSVGDIIKTELNIKNIEFLTDTSGILVKRIKPNFKTLGPKYGKLMKEIGGLITILDTKRIIEFEQNGAYTIYAGDQTIVLTLEDVEIISEDIPGWLVSYDGTLTIALDITITDELREEGIAREFINRIQNFRKESGLNVTDKIRLQIESNEAFNAAIEKHRSHIASETLCESIEIVSKIELKITKTVEIDNDVTTSLGLEKI